MLSTFKRMGAVALAAALAAGAPARAEEVVLTISGSGGTLADVLKEKMQDPFAAEAGLKVRAVATTNRVAALKAMKATGKALWDVTELSGPEYEQAVAGGFLLPIDWSQVDPEGKMPASAKPRFGLATASYSTILAVRTDKLPAGKAMTSWRDFWDVKSFPGPRALQNKPLDNLEFALIADGVDKDKVYDLLSTKSGVDRAFRKLDEIKPHIVAWWTAGAQPVQLLTNGDAFYTTAWNGRITKLASDGVPADIVWNGGSLKPSFVSIPVGAKHVKQAHQYLAFLIKDPQRNADYAKAMPYPGFVPKLYDYMTPEVARTMPTFPANADVQFTMSDKFWVEHQDELTERWEAWLQKK